MTYNTLDETHDPQLQSWVSVSTDSHFPIQNLPFGVFKKKHSSERHICTAIGDFVVDLKSLHRAKLLRCQAFESEYLNDFMALGQQEWIKQRKGISQLLAIHNTRLKEDQTLRQQTLLPFSQIEMCMPAQIGDYTDFYSSKEHATNVGSMFRGKDNALMPNWTHLPVAYHGRSSSVILSGEPIRRPMGQSKADDATSPSFGPCKLLDFELEMGFFVGPSNTLGSPISVDQAEEHIFGLALVNDWSARDIQKWEYQPLGPFLAKNFATSISPWIVTLQALEPFRCAGPVQDPAPLPYLKSQGPGLYDISLEVFLKGEQMQNASCICQSNFKNLYWDMRQQLAHHTITGCNLRPGDLMASGTISGKEEKSRGSLLELAWRGTTPLEFPNGEKRSFLQDGDTVSMTGFCQGDGFRIGFGEVSASILPAMQAEPAMA